jgi:DNA-binding NarL/FixJ family response regulator
MDVVVQSSASGEKCSKGTLVPHRPARSPRRTRFKRLSVGIVDSAPIYRRGLAAVCEEDALSVHELAPNEIASASDSSALVVVLRSESDWSLLGRTSAQVPTRPTVAVLPALETTLVERAFSAGATGVMEMGATIAEAQSVIQAALSGRALVPRDVERQLATGPPRAEAPSAREVEWLRSLAGGLTVAQLADRAGYSERQMYRRLTRVYEQLGVAGRTQALLHVQRLGLLAEGDVPPHPASD